MASQNQKKKNTIVNNYNTNQASYTSATGSTGPRTSSTGSTGPNPNATPTKKTGAGSKVTGNTGSTGPNPNATTTPKVATNNTKDYTGWAETVKDGSTTTGYTTAQDRTNAWNTTVNEKINAAKAAGKTVQTFYDTNGMLHYTTQGDAKFNAMQEYYGTQDGKYAGNANATYNMGGQTYEVNPQKPVSGGMDIYGYINNTLSNQERIKSYYDKYLPAMIQSGKAAADSAYLANSNAALNTRTESLKDAKENYIRNVASKNSALEEARINKGEQMSSVDDNYFAQLQQGRENAASRGLSNSGLMQALDQGVMSEANAQRAAIDQQYTAQVNQLNREISTLVETYGLSKAEADKIYNDTIQSLEAQRQSDYQKVTAEAQQKAIEYEFGVDSFNANAYNDAQNLKAQLGTQAWQTQAQIDAQKEMQDKDLTHDRWKTEEQLKLEKWQTEYQGNVQITLQDMANKNNMDIAELQDATDRWEATLDSDTKKWISQFDRETQIQIANLDNASRERIAQISASGSINAATAAANIEYKAYLEGMDIQSGWMEKQYALLAAEYGLDPETLQPIVNGAERRLP